MAVSFLTRLQQTINTALSSEPPVSPTTSTSNLPKPTQETPTKSSCWLLDPESSTPTPPGHLPAERGRSLATPNGSSLGTSNTSGDTLPAHLDARLYMDQQDMFSPSDRTITQATGSTSRGSVDRDPIVLGGNLPPGSVGLRGVEGTDSTPSTATVKRFERPEEDEVEAETKRRRRKRGVNETLVIVRPPPTSGSKKLMNLQIQLVLDVDRDKKKSKSRSTSVSSTATGSESIGLPLDLPSPSILNKPTGVLRRPEAPSRLSTPVPSPPSTPGAGSIPGDSPTGRRTRITIAEPRSQSRPGSVVRNPSGDDKEVLKTHAGLGSTSDPEGVNHSTPSSSDSERQKRRDRRLSRASSMVSQTSVTSNVSAISGISGVSGLSESIGGSGTRTSKRGKRIVPMYNLSVHNVMTTSVTDAGTDEKVAKFLKRAVDIHSVGSLEPAEIWHPYALDSRLPHLTPHQTRSDTGSPENEDKVWGFNSTSAGNSTAGPSTATNKRNSIDSPTGLMSRMEQEDRAVPATSGKTKQFFGKLFKKKETANESGPRESANGSGMISPARSSFVASSAERLLSPLSPASTRVFHGGSEARNSIVSAHSVVPNQHYASHTFGLYPMVSTAPDASLGEGSLHRPMGYTFTVKKWAGGKGGLETMIAPPSWAARFASTDKPMVGAGPEGSEVVFEWSRGKGKPGRLSRADGSRSAHGTIPMPIRSSSLASTLFGDTLEVPSAESSRPNSMISLSDDAHPVLSVGQMQQQQQAARKSIVERARSDDRMTTSRSSSPAPSSRAPTRLSNHDDESDPEDSETPWVCRVYVPGRRDEDGGRTDEKKGTRKSRRREGGHDGEGIVVATLYPAPHHPRVIAQVKVSTDYMPVATGVFRATPAPASQQQHTSNNNNNHIHTNGHGATTAIKGDEILLSEENVKDVVGVTAMWLVVREDFGGLVKKKKAVETRR